jgi:hypothetical protein
MIVTQEGDSMTTPDSEDERETQNTEGRQMGDQGPSYSSSYNESTPGEIIENRRTSLREEEASGDQGSDGGED